MATSSSNIPTSKSDSANAFVGGGSKRSLLIPLGCFLLLTILWGWPLLSELKTAVPGPENYTDITEYIWNTGWVRQALTTEASLFQTDALFVPFETDLRLNVYGLLQGLAAFPLTAVLGIVGAFNAILLLTVFLNGIVSFIFLRSEVNAPTAALVGASWLMLADPILSQVTGGRTGLGSVWIITGSLWASKKLFDQPRPRFGLALGLFLLAALFTDFQILFFTTIWLLLYGFYRVYFERDSLTIRPLITALGLAGLIVGLPFAAVYLPVFLRAESTGYPSPGFAGMLVFSFQLKHFLWPAIWPLLAGGYEMVLALFAALIFFRWTGRYRFWLVSAFVFLILALGPYLQPTRIPMPFAAFSLLEPLQQFRTPARLTIAAVIGFSAVVAHLLAALLPRLRSSRLLYLAAAILIGIKLTFAVSRHPLLLQTYPNYPIYSELAEETADFTILEIPVGVRSGLEKMGSGGERVQYYQHIHGKHLINGSMARLPSSIFTFYKGNPALIFLSGEPTPASDEELTSNFADVLTWSNSEYVLLHRSLLEDDLAQGMEQFLDTQPNLHRLREEADLVIYRVVVVDPATVP